MGLTIPMLGVVALVAGGPSGSDGRILFMEGRGRLGVSISDVDAETAKSLKLPEERGVRITGVENDSPAEDAGLKEDDVLWEFRGEPVWSARQLHRLVEESPPGREVALTYYRGGARQTARIRLGSGRNRWSFPVMPPDWEMVLPRGLPPLDQLDKLDRLDRLDRLDLFRRPRIGVTVSSMTKQLAEYFGAKDGGVLVTEVESESPAQKAGIQAGDVITRINGKRVETPGDVRSAVTEDGEVSVELVREKKLVTVKVSLPASPRRERRM